MLVDLRTYTLKPGCTQDYLDRYERELLALQQDHLGRMLGYFVSDSGILNQVVHLWAYENAADREKRRTALWANQRYIEAAKSFYPLIQSQENKLLKPTSFSTRLDLKLD